MEMKDLKQRMKALIDSMSQGAYEREEAISLALLAAMAGESIFLLGLPGVGKSMIARRLKLAFQSSKSFEYLMSRFSTPDEIFGPVSISKLKDEDTYERVINGYLPTADIVFLDEIWKAGPAIQNSLLTALNERIFRNGNHDVKLPLKAIISASNELPAEGEGLEALWDRFLVRYVVEPIREREAFLKLLTEQECDCVINDNLSFSDQELLMIKKQAAEVSVPSAISKIICKIRDVLTNEALATKALPTSENIPYVSDRRWRKIMGILRMSALLNGRSQIDYSDCLLLEHLIWDADDQILAMKRIVADSIVEILVVDQPTSIIADDLNAVSVTKPVGNILSPDGIHYVFSAGGEDVLISKTDYESLNQTTSYGKMTSDNVLMITKEKGEFMVKKTQPGNIVLNAFTYMLKRDSPLRTGNSDTLLAAINTNANQVSNSMLLQMERNIFLRPVSSYPELHSAFEHVKIDKSYFKPKR